VVKLEGVELESRAQGCSKFLSLLINNVRSRRTWTSGTREQRAMAELAVRETAPPAGRIYRIRRDPNRRLSDNPPPVENSRTYLK
jgi:hypothetical protein